MAAFTASQASITNGSKVVTINSGESIANIRQGDFLFLAGFLVEINRGYVGSASQQYIDLVKNWANSSQSSQPAVVIPTTGDFRAAVDAINNANQNVNDNFVAMQNWQTNMGTVTFTNQDGTTTTVKTLKQIEADNEAQMDAYHPYPWAMRKVEFEARRAANNKKFAASGFVHLGKHRNVSPNYTAINEGLFTEITAPNILNLGSGVGNPAVSGVSKSALPVVNINGVVTKISSLSVLNTGYQANRIKFPPAEDGTRTYDHATGVPVTHATPAIAFASETATNKVVTDRVDMWGFEFFLREINDADPFVYAKGLIQSQATSINGVPTVEDNVQPITYFAWYEGDTTSRGKGVNWQTASEAQRIVIASDPENNIYFDDSTGKFYQWSPRGRSFAGVGNGDWSNLDASNPALNTGLQFNSTLSVVKPQGIKDAVNKSIANYTDDSIGDFLNYNNSFVQAEGFKNSRGAFAVRAGTTSNNNQYAVKGECYFLVCGTVSRLNKGAYHPSFNPLGTYLRGRSDGSGNGEFWYSSTAYTITNKSDTFDITKNATKAAEHGGIGGVSGRPDGRFYDAIYASGAGGVCRDMRYSAWGLKAEDFADADLAIKSGKYRGREKLIKTKFIPETVTVGAAASFSLPNNSSVSFITSASDNPRGITTREFEGQESSHWILVGDNDQAMLIRRVNNITGYVAWPFSNNGVYLYGSGDVTDEFNSKFPVGTKLWLGASSSLESSIAGEYTHTEVMGDPANILLCDDLKDGWVGSWLPVLADGSSKKFPQTRPLAEQLPLSYTVDSGGSWVSYNSWSSLALFDEIKDEWNGSFPANGIYVINYKTKAGMTQNSINSELHGGKQGIGSVFITQGYLDWAGADLGYSLIGKILDSTGDGNSLFFNNIPLKDFKIYNGKLGGWTSNEKANPTHATDYNFGPPENSPVAFKALNYNVVEDQQGFINYAYTELTHNGTDWGDDGKIHIADNQTTMLDENGNTVLVGTARCVEPLGWIKNDK